MAGMDGQALNSSSAIAVELDLVRDKLYLMQQQAATLTNRIPERNSTLDVSSRLARIPIIASTGSTFGAVSIDGGPLGNGGGTSYAFGVLLPTYFCTACAITEQAIVSTDEKSKSVEDVAKAEIDLNLKQHTTNMESLLCTSDGSGNIAAVTVTPTGVQPYLQLDVANNLSPKCTYQVLSADHSVNRGNIIVNTVGSVQNVVSLIINPSTGLYWPTGTVAGDVIVIYGVTGATTQVYNQDYTTSATISESLNGIPTLNVTDPTNSTYWFGLPRSMYPYILDTPTVMASGAITPPVIQEIESFMQRANDVSVLEDEDMFTMANVGQVSQWESLGLVTTPNVNTQFVNSADKSGDTRIDVMKAKRVKTLAGWELVANIKAKTERIDWINPKHIFKVQTLPTKSFDVGGLTMFPAYASDGGVTTTMLYYFLTGENYATDNPRAAGYITGLAEPAWSS
jgi:hypothetical protein